MSFQIKIIFPIFGLMLFFAGAASAQDTSPELDALVAGQSSVSYLDLVKMVIPDIQPQKPMGFTGHIPVVPRHITGEAIGDPAPDPVVFYSIQALPIHTGGKPRLVLFMDLGNSEESVEGMSILALYDMTGTPKLLDVVNVATDRDTGLAEPPSISLGAGDDVIITVSNHFNSNQSYVMSTMSWVRDDKFTMIDDVFTFGETLCGLHRIQEPHFRSVEDSGNEYDAIKVTVALSTEIEEQECDGVIPTQEPSTEVSATYHWNAAAGKFVADSDALEKLAEQNQARF